MDAWWTAWLEFMFVNRVYERIKPHPEKYHAELTPQEIVSSQSLQASNALVLTPYSEQPATPSSRCDV